MALGEHIFCVSQQGTNGKTLVIPKTTLPAIGRTIIDTILKENCVSGFKSQKSPEAETSAQIYMAYLDE